MYMEKEILKLDDFGRGITYVDNIVTFVKKHHTKRYNRFKNN